MNALLERVKFLSPERPEVAEVAGPLPELVDGYDRDPLPVEPAVEPRGRKPKPPDPKPRQPRTGGRFVSSKAVQQGVADEIEMGLRMLAMAWSVRDEECSAVLNDTSAKIAADLAALASRSEWLMEHYQETGWWRDLLKLLTHLSPLLRTMWAHHRPGAPAELPADDPNGAGDYVGYDASAYGPWRPQQS